MARHHKNDRRQGRLIRLHLEGMRVISCLLFCVTGMSVSGCAFHSGFLSFFNSKKQCALPPDASLSEVVAHLNGNIANLRSWRSTDAKIVASGGGAIPMRLSAQIAVEEPTNFHLTASTLGSQQVDLGSNSERFWFWTRIGGPKNVLTARHEDLHLVQQVPFQPQWVMDALGVIPLNETELVMQRQDENGNILSLVSERVMPDGRPVRRVTLVDACRGIIVSHALYDASDRLIARAELNKYRLVSANGVVLPHEIHFDWPQAGLAMTINIGNIEINPTDIPADRWRLPVHRNCPPLDLATLPQRPLQHPTANTGRVRMKGARTGRPRPGNNANTNGPVRHASNENGRTAETVRERNASSQQPESERWAPPLAEPARRRPLRWWQSIFGRKTPQ